MRAVWIGVVVLLLPGAVIAGETTQGEDFEDLVNDAGWIVNPAQDFIDPEDGHEGAFLRTPAVSFAPSPRTTLGVESIFTGNYRARNVTALGIDLKTFANTAAGRPDVKGWTTGTLRSTSGMTRRSVGTSTGGGDLGASLNVWK